MKRSVVIITVFLCLLATATGCWNRRELNELGIAVAMGIDRVEDEYLVTFQIVDPGQIALKTGGGNRAPVTSYQERGKTLFEAIRKITTLEPRKTYMAHLRMLIIGEKLASRGIGEVLDLMSRDQEFRTDFFITVIKGGEASEALKILLPIEKIPAQNLFAKLENAEENWAAIGSITLDELIQDIVSEGKEPVVTGLEIIGDRKIGITQENVQQVDSPARIKYKEMAIFKKDKLIGWLNEKESKGFNHIHQNVKSTIITFPCPQKGNISIEIIRSQSKTKGKVEKGKPSVLVEIQVEGNVADVECEQIDLTNTQTIYELEKKTEQDIKAAVMAALKKARIHHTDIFGFGDAIHRADPKAWKKLKPNWDQEFTDLKVQVKVKARIRRTGTLGNSFLNEFKKGE